METVIFIIVILTLIRGISIMKRSLICSSAKGTIEKLESDLAKAKEISVDKGQGFYLCTFLVMLMIGATYFGLAIYALAKLI